MLQDYEVTRKVAIDHAIKVYDVPADRLQAFQDSCVHSTRRWVEVENIPLEVRQYDDDRDWICMVCGKLIPTF